MLDPKQSFIASIGSRERIFSSFIQQAYLSYLYRTGESKKRILKLSYTAGKNTDVQIIFGL